MKKLFSIIFITSMLFLTHSTSIAAQTTGLSISPPVIEVLLAPNKSYTQSFQVQINSPSVQATPSIHLVHPLSDQGHSIVDPNPIDLSSIPLTITSPTHKLNVPFTPGSDKTTITLNFESASTDLTQDIYLALVITLTPLDSLQNSSSSSPAISALILTTITPDGLFPVNLELTDFTLPLIHDSWHKLELNPSLKNSSPIMFRPLGTFSITNPLGKSIYSKDITPSLILANSARQIKIEDSDSNSSPSFIPAWSNIGPYRFKLTITTPGGTKLTESEKVVWILPIRAFLIMFLISIIIYRLTHPIHNNTVDN